MKINILICSWKECTGQFLDLNGIKQYFQNNGHEVIIYEKFCQEINNHEFSSPFSNPKRPTVFAGCSPLGMEVKLKLLFDTQLEIANIREQCSWLDLELVDASDMCCNIIELASRQVPYTPVYNPPANVLGARLTEYISIMDKIGPNPFKV